jgi:hypothetical protein
MDDSHLHGAISMATKPSGLYTGKMLAAFTCLHIRLEINALPVKFLNCHSVSQNGAGMHYMTYSLP